MAKVIITGWREGLLKISMTQIIQAHTSLGLRSAKSVTDRVMDRDAVELVVDSIQEAEILVDRLQAVGAEARVASE